MYKKIFIKTFGCQMNEYDSGRIYDTVKEIGYKKTSNYEEADCYLLNTCHIRDKAKEKVYHEIGRVKKIFRSKSKPLVIITGCVAQAENNEMLKREPYIDLIIGPQAYHKINDTIYDVDTNIILGKRIYEPEIDTCKYCNIEMKLLHAEGLLKCERCGLVDKILIDSDKLSLVIVSFTISTKVSPVFNFSSTIS